MDAREAIVDLLDSHSGVLSLSRRQLAELAGVNAGQLSNWLRNAGPLSGEREGKVVQAVLDKVEAALGKQPPPEEQTRTALSGRGEVLRLHGPRRRLAAAEPENALKGHPISPENPYYIKRAADTDLEAKLRAERDPKLLIVGGPKTGKSSLLLAAQGMLESDCTVLHVDFEEYRSQKQIGSETATQAEFLGWFSDRCEMQIEGSFRDRLASSEGAVKWVVNNVLPKCKNQRCVVFIDSVEKLPVRDPKNAVCNWEFKALDLTILNWVDDKTNTPALKSLGVVVAADLGWPLVPGTGQLESSHTYARLNYFPVANMGQREVDSLLIARAASKDSLGALREVAWSQCGGQAYLTQCFASGITDPDGLGRQKVAAGVEEIGEIISERWSPELRKSVAEEIDRTLGREREASQAAWKRLIETGLCVRAVSDKDTATGSPIRPVNDSLLGILRDRIRSGLSQ